MDPRDIKLKEEISKALYMHGKLSLLFYKTMDEWLVHKWGEFEKLTQIHQKLFDKYHAAGFSEEANSLTLMELPNDVEMIFRILTCGSLKKTLQDIGYISEEKMLP